MDEGFFERLRTNSDGNLNSLIATINSEIAFRVPDIYEVRDADMKWKKREALKMILIPMEQFICGHRNPSEFWNRFLPGDARHAKCLKIIKPGETVYTCAECSTNFPNELCSECFLGGPHRDHWYTAIQDEYTVCDCGDSLQSGMHSYCEIHSGIIGQHNGTHTVLPNDVIERSKVVINYLALYAFSMLSNKFNADFPEQLRRNLSPEKYVLSFEEEREELFEEMSHKIEGTFRLARQRAVALTAQAYWDIDPVLCCSTRERCLAKVDELSSAYGDDNFDNAPTMAVRTIEIDSHRRFAADVLDWLVSMIRKSDDIRAILCERLLKATRDLRDPCHHLLHQTFRFPQPPGTVFLDEVLKNDINNSFAVSMKSLQLVLTALEQQPEHRNSLAERLLACYPTLVHQNYEGVPREFGFFTILSGYIFKRPFAVKLLLESRFLSAYSNMIHELTIPDYVDGYYRAGQNTLPNRRPEVFGALFRHVCTAFSTSPHLSESFWCENSERQFTEEIASLSSCLIYLEDFNEVTRKTGEHVITDPEWLNGFSIQIMFQRTAEYLVKWCSSNVGVLKSVVRDVAHIVGKHIERRRHSRIIPVAILDHEAICIHQNSEEIPITFHLPVTRLLAALCLQLARRDSTFSHLTSGENPLMDCVLLMQSSLRLLVARAEAKANMWVRNGDSFRNQMLRYNNLLYRLDMISMDIVILQIAASQLPANVFLIHVIEKFNLAAFFSSTIGDLTLPEENKMLLDMFLHLLIAITGERYVEGVGCITCSEIVKHEIVHLLALGGKTYRELTNGLPGRILRRDDFNECLQEVADVGTSSDGSKIFTLKREMYYDVSPMYYYYSDSDLLFVEESQTESIKWQCSSSESQRPRFPLSIPALPQFTPSFTNISELLYCKIMIHIMTTVLSVSSTASNSRVYGPLCRKVLHLITLAFREDRRRLQAGDASFPFLSTLARDENAELKSLLISQTRSTDDLTKALAQWLLAYIRDTTAWVLAQVSNEMRILLQQLGSAAEADVTAGLASTTLNDRERKSEKLRKLRLAMEARQKIPTSQEVANNASEVAGPSGVDTASGTQNALETSSATTLVEDEFCALCLRATEEGFEQLVCLAYVQRSSVLSQNHPPSRNPSLLRHWITPANVPLGIHIMTCGHPCHLECLLRHIDNQRLANGGLSPHVNAYNARETLNSCPVCRRIGNATMPIVKPVWQQKIRSKLSSADTDRAFERWIVSQQRILDRRVGAIPPQQLEDTLDSVGGVITHSSSDSESTSLFEIYWDRCSNARPQSVGRSSLARYVFHEFRTTTSRVVPEFLLEGDDQAIGLWSGCAYTIQMLEQTLRLDKKSFLNADESARNRRLISALINCAVYARETLWTKTAEKTSGLLLKLLLKPDMQNLPESDYDYHDTVFSNLKNDIISMDLWHLLVIACLSSLKSEGNEVGGVAAGSQSNNSCFVSTVGEQFLLRMVLVAHVVQVILSGLDHLRDAVNAADESEPNRAPSQQCEDSILDVFGMILRYSGISDFKVERKQSAAVSLENYIRDASMPFLRCSLLFLSLLSGVLPPEGFSEYDFDSVCRFLGLPNKLSVLFACGKQEITKIVRSWCQIHAAAQSLPYAPEAIAHPLTLKPLIELPYNYGDLLERAASFTCYSIPYVTSMRNPMLCLLCGTIVCSGRLCCGFKRYKGLQRLGPASHHAGTCGLGTCIFLRIKEGDVIFLSLRKGGCFYAAPYVDAHGQGFHKQHPDGRFYVAMHLCERKYGNLKKMWYDHNFHNEVFASRSSTFAGDWMEL